MQSRDATMIGAAALLCAAAAGIELSAQVPPAVNPAQVAVQEAQTRLAEAKVRDLQQQIIEIDGVIEARVQDILETLTPLTDSTQTGTSVARRKEEVVKGLLKSAQLYAQARQKLENEAGPQVPIVSEEIASQQVAALDERVNRRLDQIIQLTSSLAETKDIDKYQYSHDHWTGYTSWSVSDDYRQNRRVSSRAATAREKLIEDVQRAIQSLEDQNRRLDWLLSYPQPPQEQRRLQELIQNNNQRLEERRRQLVDLASESSPATRALGKKEFQTIDKLLDQYIAEVKQNYATLQTTKRMLDMEIKNLDVQRRRLAWMQGNAAAVR